MISTSSAGQLLYTISIRQTLVLPLTGPMRSRLPRRSRFIGVLAGCFWKAMVSEARRLRNCWKKLISSGVRMTSRMILAMESW
jgi:hypothetical protein